MNISKRQLNECEQSEPLDMSLNKRARDEPVVNEPLDMRLEEGQDPSQQNCPLDLSMGKRKSDGIIKSPVSGLHGLKKTEAVVNDDLSLGIEKSDGVSVSPVSSLQELKKTEETVGLDLSMGGRKSAVSSLRGVKKSNTTVQGERAATSEEVIKIPCVVEEPGVRYPLDVWFLIADYIVPESVGKFARICKDSLHVTYTAIFWCKLFKRYCTDGRITEASFKVIRKQRGLRTRVIRSLHRIYKPLAMKRETDLNPPMLLNRLIRSQWVERNRRGTEWIYHFELYDFYNKSRWKPEKFDEWWNDITVNQSAYCVMLKHEQLVLEKCNNQYEIPVKIRCSNFALHFTNGAGKGGNNSDTRSIATTHNNIFTRSGVAKTSGTCTARDYPCQNGKYNDENKMHTPLLPYVN
ncbi:uncharacterized protein LOC126471481 isoform X1 [Schistocerca serialis cubense]|uniref:uncharacterized protein LOC126471481 isoform X1 n=1 Tax=Schistocerca serialis cubense TaxID=2023355 RepID=UPI00214ECD33|nr:uncharacterized protein LOC126471481 isoform X1 [Schistocerca serialis cubense]